MTLIALGSTLRVVGDAEGLPALYSPQFKVISFLGELQHLKKGETQKMITTLLKSRGARVWSTTRREMQE